jgi:hypothetical protein
VVPHLDVEQLSSARKGVVHLPFEWTIDRG